MGRKPQRPALEMAPQIAHFMNFFKNNDKKYMDWIRKLGDYNKTQNKW